MVTMGDNGQGLPALTPSDIDTTINHEPRIRDLRLAEALGMANPHAIRRLIERHREVLGTFGEVSHLDAKPNRRGGRPSKSFYLTKRQALYITAKSDTERAALVTIQMVELFESVTSGKGLPPSAAALTKADLDAIDLRARDLGEAEERRARAALTADALDRIRQGRPVDAALLSASPPSFPLLPPPAPRLDAGTIWDLPFDERSLIMSYRDLPPARREQCLSLVSTAADYVDSLRALWQATAAAGLWDGIADLIESHADRFRRRVPLG